MKFYFLTKDFFDTYSNCNEIEKKENRPYACSVLIDYEGITFAIPLRSHIKHQYAIFSNAEKTKGLDLSKSVVINDLKKFVDQNTKVFIDDEEYKFFLGKEYFVQQKLKTYIKLYKKALTHQENRKNQILCKNSTLQYFHKELGI